MEAAMIAVAWRYVSPVKGEIPVSDCATRQSMSPDSLELAEKPGGQGKPPFSGPITKGMGPLRWKNAKGLGNTGDIGTRRSTTSKSPAKMRRPATCRHARHSKGNRNG